MIIISIDIETTGLDPENNHILSIGAIIENTESKLSFDRIPKFHVAILHREVRGSLIAINMNRELIEYISLYQSSETDEEKENIIKMSGLKFFQEDEVVEEFFNFLCLNGIHSIPMEKMLMHHCKEVDGKRIPCMTSKMSPTVLTVAGKNFATFDKLFLERLPRWKQAIKIRQRMIDPGVLFTDWKNDETIPNLDKCKQRAKVEGIVTHNALEDAWDVIQLLRTQYKNIDICTTKKN